MSMGIYAARAGGAGVHPCERLLRLPGSCSGAPAAGEKVGAYRYDGLWFDIGRRDDYEEARRGLGRGTGACASTRSGRQIAVGKGSNEPWRLSSQERA